MEHQTLKDLSKEIIIELVSLAKKGDKKAMSQIISISQLELTRFLYGLSRNQHTAQDLCQDSLVKALKSISKLQEPDKLRSWLYTIARNTFYDFKRKKAPMLQDEESDFVEESKDSQADTNLSVRRALSELSLDEQTILMLIDMNGYSYVEAAEIVGISEAAVRSRLHRARKGFLSGYEEMSETNE